MAPLLAKERVELRKRCYLDISIGERSVGRIIVELYDDVVPRTAENFRGICTAEYGMGQSTKKKLSYQGVLFHRVIPGFMIQAGDFSAFDGTGGESIYGGKFQDENFKLKHDRPYLLSMANAGKDLNGSQFFITCVPCPTLDGKHVVFGQLVQGMDIVQEIERCATDASDRPLQSVKISKCGQLLPVYPASSAASSSVLKTRKKDRKKKRESSSASDSAQSHSAREKKKKRRQKKASNLEKEESKDNDRPGKTVEAEAYCTIRAEEIPDIPFNKFLLRRTSPRPLPADSRSTLSGAQPGACIPSKEEKHTSSLVTSSTTGDERKLGRPYGERRDCQGITVKGRGAVRYSRRSATPPHWHRTRQRLNPSFEGRNAYALEENRPRSTKKAASLHGAKSRSPPGREKDSKRRSGSPRKRSKDKEDSNGRDYDEDELTDRTGHRGAYSKERRAWLRSSPRIDLKGKDANSGHEMISSSRRKTHRSSKPKEEDNYDGNDKPREKETSSFSRKTSKLS